MAVRAILFCAVGTAGQRCTTLRRLFVHEGIYDTLLPALNRAYAGVRIGNPLDPKTLVGPLIDEASFDGMRKALDAARTQGGTVHGGARVTDGILARAFYVRPAIVEMPGQTESVRRSEEHTPELKS